MNLISAKKILIVSTVPTHPPVQGNSKSILSYTQMLVAIGYKVLFLYVSDGRTDTEQVQMMRDYWKEDFIYYKRSDVDRVSMFFTKRIYYKLFKRHRVDYLYPSGLSKFVKDLYNKIHFDTVIANYIFLSKIFYAVPKNVVKVLHTHDVFSDRLQRTGDAGFSVSVKDEKKALDRASVVLAVQEEEASFFRTITNTTVINVYTYFDIIPTTGVSKNNLLFLAGANVHNMKGILFFADQVMPLIKQKNQDAKLLIGGSICKNITRLQNNADISLLGYVDDLKFFYSHGNIVINPVSSGTGLKIKSFEALGYGKLLVSDPHNTIGIFDKEHAPIMEAETAEQYAEIIIGLMESNELLNNTQSSIAYMERLNSYVRSMYKKAVEFNVA